MKTKAEELTLEISVTDVEAMRAAIKITPSDNSKTSEKRFCTGVIISLAI